jgi:hypothetical protein
MGVDITCIAQRQEGEIWTFVDWAFDWRSYGLFGFFANVRNYSLSPVISEPRGRPADLSGVDAGDDRINEDLWSASWLSLAELIAYDYSAEFEDRRSGGETLPQGKGQQTTLRAFLGEGYFEELDRLQALGAQRIVFGFS